MEEMILSEPRVKNRGVSATLKVAYDVCVKHFRKIFKHLWLMAMVTAVAGAVSYAVSVQPVDEYRPSDAIMMFGLLALSMVVNWLFFSRMLMLVNGESWGYNMLRTAKVWALLMVVFMVMALICAAPLLKGWWWATALLALVMLAALVPFTYSAMKYLCDSQTPLFSVVGRHLKVGARHWGYLFAVGVAVLVISLLVSVVLMLPSGILSMASLISADGELGGDPSGLPQGFSALMFVVAAVTLFVYQVVSLYSLFTAAFACGTVEAREQEQQMGRRINEMVVPETDV